MERHKKPTDSADVIRRAMQVLQEGRIEAFDGGYYKIVPDTLLVHGDNPKSIENIRALRSNLKKAGIEVASFD
jgi:UPF0271 protein